MNRTCIFKENCQKKISGRSLTNLHKLSDSTENMRKTFMKKSSKQKYQQNYQLVYN